jgi:hypothetical protein
VEVVAGPDRVQKLQVEMEELRVVGEGVEAQGLREEWLVEVEVEVRRETARHLHVGLVVVVVHEGSKAQNS